MGLSITSRRAGLAADAEPARNREAGVLKTRQQLHPKGGSPINIP